MNSKLMFWFILFVGLFGDVMWFLALIAPKSLDIFLIFSPNGADMGSVADSEALRLVMGIVGAVMTGWALTMFEATKTFPSTNSAWLQKPGNLMLSGLIAWFVMDSILSIVTTFYVNVAFNLVFLLFGWVAIQSYQSS